MKHLIVLHLMFRVSFAAWPFYSVRYSGDTPLLFNDRVQKAVDLVPVYLEGKYCKEFFTEVYGADVYENIRKQPANVEIKDIHSRLIMAIHMPRTGTIILNWPVMTDCSIESIAVTLVHELAHHATLIQNLEKDAGLKEHEGTVAERALYRDFGVTDSQ